MQGLRAKDNVDERCSFGNTLTFLAGDAATHTNLDIGVFHLELPPATQFRKHLLLGLLSNRARIHKQQVGIARRIRQFVAV